MKKFLAVLLTFALMLSVLTGCASETNDTNKENEESPKEEVLKNDDERFVNLLRDLNSYIDMKDREEGYKSFENYEIGIVAFKNLETSDFTKTNKKSESGGYYYNFKGSALEEKIKKYFGPDATFDKKAFVGASSITKADIPEGSGAYIESYDEKADTYLVSFAGIGGGGPEASINDKEVVSAVLKGNQIEVSQKAIYLSSEMGNNNMTYKIYSDPNRNNLIDTKKMDYETAYQNTIDVKDYLDKASTITIIFQKHEDSDDYYFYKSTINIEN